MEVYTDTILHIRTLLVFVFVLLISYRLWSRPRNLPPGPWALPLLGSLGFVKRALKKKPYLVLEEEAKKYGSVIGVWIGPKLVVFLHGYDTVYRAFVKQAPDLNDRPNWIPQIRMAQGKGISWQNGLPWKNTRKFVLQSLREFGVGQAAQEEKIRFEVNALTEFFENTNGIPTSVGDIMQTAVSNVICNVVFGKRFEYDDAEFKRVLKNFDVQLSGQGFVSLSNYVPKSMQWLFPQEMEQKAAKEKASMENKVFITKQIDEHIETFDPANIRDFVDMYVQVYKEEERSSDQDEIFTKDNMRRVIIDIFLAGSETTSTALDWCFLYMVEYPEAQKKCQDLLSEMVGERNVKWSDRSNLPFIESTIQEVLRLAHVVPFSVPRTCSHDIVLNGYTIPAKTVVIPSLYSTDMDPSYWTDPEVFKPDRFLDNDGKLIKRESFIPFSIGPRNCPGEQLARMELFLIFASLLQRFEFRKETEGKTHNFSPKEHHLITLPPSSYKLRATRRV